MVILRTHLRLPRRSLRQAGPFRPGGLIRIAGAACIAAAGSAAVPIPAAAATARVPAVAPPSAWASARPIAVTSLRDSGAGSLRAAIKSANAGSPGKSAVIDFRVGGVITLASRAGTRRNRVINNYIGLDRFGRRLPNSGHAVIKQGPR